MHFFHFVTIQVLFLWTCRDMWLGIEDERLVSVCRCGGGKMKLKCPDSFDLHGYFARFVWLCNRATSMKQDGNGI